MLALECVVQWWMRGENEEFYRTGGVQLPKWVDPRKKCRFISLQLIYLPISYQITFFLKLPKFIGKYKASVQAGPKYKTWINKNTLRNYNENLLLVSNVDIGVV